MFIQVASSVLGDIKILKMHFSGFFGVKVHNFCVNAIPAPGRKFTSLGWINPCAINNIVKILPVFVYCSDLMADHKCEINSDESVQRNVYRRNGDELLWSTHPLTNSIGYKSKTPV